MAVVAVALTACGSQEESGPVPRELTGVVVEVESAGLGEVRGFTLRSEGRNYRVHLAKDVELGFPPAHLNEHLATADPVRVELTRRNGKLFALSIADA